MSAITSLSPTVGPSGPPALVQPSPGLEDSLYEIVDGQRVELPPKSIFASIVGSRIHARMHLHVETHQLGTGLCETLFILDPVRDLRRRPGVAFVSKDRWPLDREIPETGDWQVVPDLAVEVLSPNDVMGEVLAKVRGYFRVGVTQVWLVVPFERQVYVYSKPDQVRVVAAPAELDAGQLIPGFVLALEPLFARQARPLSTSPEG